MQLLTVILSSAVISSIVTIILGYVFENRRYIKDKRIQIYSEYLVQLNSVISHYENPDMNRVLPIIKKEAHRLRSYAWKVRLISRNPIIQEQTTNILKNYDEFTTRVSEILKLKNEDDYIKKVWEAAQVLKKNDIQEELLISEMNRDINKF